MGRHSAPQDDDGLSDPPATATVQAAPGRHESVDADTATLSRTESATHSDLRMLREKPALRARCAAAAIVPFLLYTAVLAVIGRADVYLLWVWIPTVIAGIAVGAFLDAAHRHRP